MTDNQPQTAVETAVEGHVATVWLNRPEVRNAFNEEMIADLTLTFDRLGADPEVRAVVLRGRGKSFSAGADINWMRASLDFTEAENIADAERMSDMFAAIDRCTRPVFAGVHGACLGGGMGLIAACDVVISTDTTVFGFTEARLGIIPSAISRVVLPKIGESWARALYLTAERFDAGLARTIGLVHWIAADEDLDEMLQQKVGEVLNSGPLAVTAAKRLIADLRGRDDQTVRGETARRIAAIRATPEGQEGLRAFLERRSPSWRE